MSTFPAVTASSCIPMVDALSSLSTEGKPLDEAYSRRFFVTAISPEKISIRNAELTTASTMPLTAAYALRPAFGEASVNSTSIGCLEQIRLLRAHGSLMFQVTTGRASLETDGYRQYQEPSRLMPMDWERRGCRRASRIV